MNRLYSWWYGEDEADETVVKEEKSFEKTTKGIPDSDSITIELETRVTNSGTKINASELFGVYPGDELHGNVIVVNSQPLPRGSSLLLQVKGSEQIQLLSSDKQHKRKEEEQTENILDVTCNAYDVINHLEPGIHTFPFSFKVPEEVPGSFTAETKSFAARVTYFIGPHFSGVKYFEFIATKTFLVSERAKGQRNRDFAYAESNSVKNSSQNIVSQMSLNKLSFTDFEKLIVKYSANSTFVKPVDFLHLHLYQEVEVICNNQKRFSQLTIQEKTFQGIPSCYYGVRYLQGIDIPSITGYSTTGSLINCRYILVLEVIVMASS